MRQSFTFWWGELGANTKSIIISIGAFFLAVVLLSTAKTLFPGTSFSEVELILTTAFSGFLVSLIKEKIKL